DHRGRGLLRVRAADLLRAQARPEAPRPARGGGDRGLRGHRAAHRDPRCAHRPARRCDPARRDRSAGLSLVSGAEAPRPTTGAGPTGPSASPGPVAVDAEAVDAVIDWFAEAGRDLPWRHEDVSAWAILVSEVMLQQTPVVRVLPRWREWMRRWPAPADLADAPTAEVLRCWDRLGYPRRALRLQECARAIVREHG